jgi:hypothetical protein
MDGDRFVFLDETGAATNMVSRRGWAPKGERLVDCAPQGHWHTTTFVGGLRGCGIIAPLVLSGPMTGEVFRAYTEQFLAPALSPGDVVVMDTSPPTRSPASPRRSRRPGRASSTCRPTAPTSTPSRWPSPS